MVIRFFSFLSLLIMSSLPFYAHAAELVATVDRTQIGEYDSLVLTVKYDEQLISGSPDFSPLQQQFEIVNKSRKNSFQMINGKTSSWTIWTIALMPQRKGNLVIPSLEFRGAKSKPIQIRVSKASEALKNKQQDVFFLTETDEKQTYVQGQIIYTEKLYFAVALDNSDISEVQVADAVVQTLGETKQYRTQLNGRAYNVFERRFAIFPQTSGELVIPGPRYSGEISNGPWRAGRPIRISHPPIKLEVLAQPASYQGDLWLPATNLSINYAWSADPNNMIAGEPATLTITLNALGLSGAQLPDIALKPVERLKYYPDQAITGDETTNDGILGNRSQKVAVVATQPGEYRIPELRIPWWNVKSKRQEYAVIPAQTLRVFAGAPASDNATTSVPVTPSASSSPNNAEPVSSGFSWWPWLTLMTTLLWLATLYLWWKKPSTVMVASHELPELSEVKSAKLSDIKKACRDNDPKAARQAILSWANAQLAASVSGLNELNSLTEDTALRQALNELDHTLYSANGNSAWQGEHIWQLIKSWKLDESNKHSNPLKDLYPKAG